MSFPSRSMLSLLPLLLLVMLGLVAVGGQPTALSSATFSNCVALSPTIQMHYTVEGDMLDMVLEGKLPDATTDSWYLSYGYSPENARGSVMVGGSAVLGGLVNGECFGYDYYLDGTLECDYARGFGSCPSFVFNENAQSTTSLVECEKSGDTLAIRMTKKLGVDEAGIPGTAWPLDSSKYAMWAAGRVDPGSTVEQPMALLHVTETLPFPGLKLALEETSNSCVKSFGIVGAGIGAASTPPSPSDDGLEQVSLEDVVTASTTAPVLAASPAPSTDPVNITEPACSMFVDGITQYFQTCSLVTRVGNNFNLMWNLTADPSDPDATIMTMAMTATMPNQYVSVGFPSKAKSMKNAAAMIMANSAAGSSLRQYYMTGYDDEDVFPSNRGMDLMTVIEPTGISSNGEVTGMFTMRLPYPYPTVDDSSAAGAQNKRRSLLASSNKANPLASLPMIFAAGKVNPDGRLRRHYDDGATNMNLAYAVGANGTSVISGVSTVENESVKVAHQVIMAIGWGVMIPLGIIGGRAKMQLSAPKWYNVHRYLQSIGYLIGLIGVGLGFGITKSWDTLYPVHRDLGITITVLATVQVASLVWKPEPGTTLRKYWGPWHIWIGRSTAMLAIANIYYGMLGMGEYNVETWAWAVYSAALGCIVALGLFSEYREFKLRRAAREHDDPEKGSVPVSSVSRATSVNGKASSVDEFSKMVDVDVN